MGNDKINVRHEMRPVREVFGNGITYRVPQFQRKYSWGIEEWDDLWQDIEALIENPSNNRYLGYIVLSAKSPTDREVIDGQQRLVTISIFALAIVSIFKDLVDRKIDPDNNEKRGMHLKKRFLVAEGGNLTEKTRLQLGIGDDTFYQHHLMPLRKPKSRNLSPSERKMWAAFEFFKRKVLERFGDSLDGAELAKILDNDGGVVNGLLFTEMQVDNNDNKDAAYMLFEILNGRGVELTGADLVKNYLFLRAAEKGSGFDLEQLGDLWQEAMSNLAAPTGFLRHFCHSRDGKVIGKRKLFREIRDGIADGNAVFPFVRDMKDAAECYQILQDPSALEWRGIGGGDLSRYLRQIQIYGVSSLLPLLLAAYRRWDAGGNFVRVVRNCVALSFRHAVIGNKNPKDLERDYTEAAGMIARGEDRNVSDILRRHYPTDAEFKSDFQYAALQQRKAKHVLLELERAESGPGFDPNDPECTLEHVFPQNPGEGWGEFGNRAAYMWRLGNLAILTRDEQRRAGNRPFAEKREIYHESGCGWTKKLAEYEDWTPESVDRRQEQMANSAVAIWKLDNAA